jgi:hypothetical protein
MASLLNQEDIAMAKKALKKAKKLVGTKNTVPAVQRNIY